MQTAVTEDNPMNADDLLYELEDFITASQHIPMTKLVVVDESKLFEYIDRIREMVVMGSAEHLQVASVFQPTAAAHSMSTPSDGGTGQSTEHEHLLRVARQDADDIRAQADAYARAVLSDVQARLERLLGSVNSGLDELNR
jgi:hypothetical protein